MRVAAQAHAAIQNLKPTKITETLGLISTIRAPLNCLLELATTARCHDPGERAVGVDLQIAFGPTPRLFVLKDSQR